ncbi:hypothetical protein Y59_23690 [Enterobacter hormaechei]|nr:hypothetical protein Y59_23690 [Enterobacter hormaechei]
MTQNITVSKVMLVEGNRVVRADGDHNALNRDVFLGKKVCEC